MGDALAIKTGIVLKWWCKMRSQVIFKKNPKKLVLNLKCMYSYIFSFCIQNKTTALKLFIILHVGGKLYTFIPHRQWSIDLKAFKLHELIKVGFFFSGNVFYKIVNIYMWKNEPHWANMKLWRKICKILKDLNYKLICYPRVKSLKFSCFFFMSVSLISTTVIFDS